MAAISDSACRYVAGWPLPERKGLVKRLFGKVFVGYVVVWVRTWSGQSW